MYSKEEVRELFEEFCNEIQAFHNSKDEFLKSKGLLDTLEVGTWYKDCKYKKMIICITDVNTLKGYGVLTTGEWNDWFFCDSNTNLTKATPSEVEEALRTEAIKQGHKYEYNKWINGRLLGFNMNNVADCLFYNGVWTKVIKENTLSVTEFFDLYEKYKTDETFIELLNKHK